MTDTQPTKEERTAADYKNWTRPELCRLAAELHNKSKALADENKRLRIKLQHCQSVMECNDPGNAHEIFGAPNS